ncbi:hypothetical protein KY289_018442 [Solanum tuberosum]|nr:hypothetical protein KY289_018442 [Solanum tuberosum]
MGGCCRESCGSCCLLTREGEENVYCYCLVHVSCWISGAFLGLHRWRRRVAGAWAAEFLRKISGLGDLKMFWAARS